jgi:hypothetical protein
VTIRHPCGFGTEPVICGDAGEAWRGNGDQVLLLLLPMKLMLWVAEGLLVVAYFNSVLRKESEDEHFDISKAAFVFPELLADFPKQ